MILADDLRTPTILVVSLLALVLIWWGYTRIQQYIENRRYSPVRQALRELGRMAEQAEQARLSDAWLDEPQRAHPELGYRSAKQDTEG